MTTIWQQLRQALKADLQAGTTRGQLVRAAGWTTVLKIVGAGVAFLASILYARVLGPEGYGLYAYVIAWTAVLSIPAGLGLPKYLVREGARHTQNLLHLRRWADKHVLLTGACAALLLAGAAFIPQATDARWLLLVAAPIPLLANLAATRQSLLQAIGTIAGSQWAKLVLAPAAMLLALLAVFAWRGALYPIDLVAASVGAALLTTIVNGLQLRPAARDTTEGSRPSPRIRDALPFMWLGGMYLLVNRTDLLMLGLLAGSEPAGHYAIASRGSELLALLGAAASMAIAPILSEYYSNKDFDAAGRLVRATSRRIFAVTAPFAVGMILLASPLLNIVYGAPYISAAVPLQILCLAQLVTLATGPLGTMLNMAGHERAHLRSISIALVANVVLNMLLIPRWGGTGAAIATLTSIILARVQLALYARKSVMGMGATVPTSDR